ncbi:IQ domain-containing protein E-like isoform X2 [Corticium candelabrum]|uniref:IQ domain-containing protein E-like isoform X2 n=1 Tax=Corticium candelabrum TaxID=121492 RepID=UPI002E25F8C8|nr:IQ domain-containing protein E-like isoform X2 [Corticium candelabrum]
MDGYSDDAFSEDSAEISVMSAGSVQHAPHPPPKRKLKQKSKHLTSRQSKYVSPYVHRPSAPLPPNDKPPPHSLRAASFNKTAREHWISALQTNKGISSESVGTNTWRGSKSRPSSGSNASTFLQDLLLGNSKSMMKPSQTAGVHTFPTSTPSYKPQEDMHDEIQELKKTQKEEKNHLVTRVRRLEEDVRKKEKKIEDMMSAGYIGASDITRSRADKRSDSSAAVASLKHQVYMLEKALKEKESQHNKHLRDMRTTDLEELRLQLEMYHHEVTRLRRLNVEQDVPDEVPVTSKSRDVKVRLKALNTAVVRLSETNKQLESENMTLKQDLDRAMAGLGHVTLPSATKRKKSHNLSQKTSAVDKYADYNRTQMLARLAELETEVDDLHSQQTDTINHATTTTDTQHRQTVKEVTATHEKLQKRIEELESSERDLIAERDKLRNIVRKLKEDRAHYRKEAETTQLDLASVRGDLGHMRDTHSASEKELLYLRQREEDEKRAREHAAKLGRQRRALVSSSQNKQHEAARVLQTSWKKHRSKKRQGKFEEDYDEAATTIQSALRGHLARKQHLQTDPDMTSPQESDEELDTASTTIQAAVRAHWAREGAIKQDGRNNTNDWRSFNGGTEPQWNTIGDSDSRKSFEREFIGSKPQHNGTSEVSSSSLKENRLSESDLASEAMTSSRILTSISNKADEAKPTIKSVKKVGRKLSAAQEKLKSIAPRQLGGSNDDEATDTDSKPNEALLDELW